MAEAIYGIGQPSGEAHARMKEALRQRNVFSSALMRPPVLPLSGEEKALIFDAVKNLKEPTVGLV
jgi:4-hydroxy-tetrahydrodipicolinate synthase